MQGILKLRRVYMLNQELRHTLKSISKGNNLLAPVCCLQDAVPYNYQDVLVGGDGSGGMTSCLLRLNPISRAVFNSLLELEGVELKGSTPSPPSALACTP
ncbi:unnamed protein product [Pieris macdunnoughi]|uniref:Mononegavirus-type SAM-dependent 2'-O-MTase domain-containing protein n=1 Tax=Pieris macdunnoughi TaxID=345717 RepID=A0A821Y1Z9_9NEOP|nr:unnamed protein product [Pieris macdunnoughi]